MPLDHFVPQVHLRQFTSPALGGRLNAVRKTDLRFFQPRPRDVCRIEDGSSNAYIAQDRAIEEFLKAIEPRYTQSVAELASDRITTDSIYVLAGFVAYVMLCSPAMMRIGAAMPRNVVKAEARLLDAAGKMPPPPEALGGKSLSDLIDSGKVKIEIDPKYAQALGIAAVTATTRMYGNCLWDIVINEHEGSPFVTSDYPVAIEQADDPRVLNRVVPLSPNLAIRICPDISLTQKDCDDTFSCFRYRFGHASRKHVQYLNDLFVKCAETTVFYRDNQEWIPGFVKRRRYFRIEPVIDEIRYDSGEAIIFRQRVEENVPRD